MLSNQKMSRASLKSVVMKPESSIAARAACSDNELPPDLITRCRLTLPSPHKEQHTQLARRSRATVSELWSHIIVVSVRSVECSVIFWDFSPLIGV